MNEEKKSQLIRYLGNNMINRGKKQRTDAVEL